MSTTAAYRAEWSLDFLLSNATEESRTATIGGATVVIPNEYKFGHIDTIRDYVNRVIDRVNADLGTNHGHVTVTEGRKTLCKKAYYINGNITVPQRDKGEWAWRQTVVLHEVAHHLTPWHGHDSVFTGMLAYLFDEFIGPEAGFMYRVLLSNEGINPTQPRKASA